MIFDDVFYPGNPERRREVSRLRAEVIDIFQSYKNAWNEQAELLMEIFREGAQETPYENMKIVLLKMDIRKNTVDECLSEMKAALDDTNKKIKKVVDDIGISDLIPNWSSEGFKVENLDKNVILAVGKALSATLGATAASFVGYCVFVNISFAITWSGFLAGAVSSVVATLGGVLGGIIAGGAAFLITDIISSAITGAIERKELNESIEALQQLKDAVEEPLRKGRDEIRGMIRNIKDGSYSLGNGWHIGKEGNEYFVYKLKNGKPEIIDFIQAA